jgi:hypothetical protein
MSLENGHPLAQVVGNLVGNAIQRDGNIDSVHMISCTRGATGRGCLDRAR